ncbi:hypothetical protein [Mycetocola zhujimingii]|uniref:Uncharacterized protein n=1 Tax=Mycetocola zhujimingii TaxID=2079792 RepID=A0A2U1TCF4_9MICO|nr:hypothetical protein [Mycetocola zhujimingii]PWC06577.1 hypothetical protein DF223_10770 [Mycetocola zhujimingii]
MAGGFELDYWRLAGSVLSALWPLLVLLVVSSALRVWVDRRRAIRKQEAEPPALALEEKMIRLTELTGEAGRLNSEVQAEILLAQSEAIQLKADADEAIRLAALNSDEREAVTSLVRSQVSEQLDKNSKRERRAQLLLNAAFFLAGVVVTLFIPPFF